MKLLSNTLLLLIMLTFSLRLNAQDPVIDSLNLAFKNAIHDTTRVKLLSELSEVCEVEDILKYAEPCAKLAQKNIAIASTTALKTFYLKHLAGASNNIGFLAKQQSDIPKALAYFHKSLNIQQEIKDKQGIASSLNNIGRIYDDQGDIPKALDYYHKSLKINEEILQRSGNPEEIRKLKEDIATFLNNIGFIYNNLGDIPKALEYFHKSLKIREEIKDKQGIAISLNNIGLIYNGLGDYRKALEYYHKSLKIREEIKYKQGIATTLNNIGLIYNNQRDLPKALEYYYKSLKIREEIREKGGIANSLNNIGRIYDDQNDIPKALDYYHKSLKIYEEINDKQGIAYSLNFIAATMLKQGKVDVALKFASRSLQTAKEIGFPENIKNVASTIKNIYKKQNKFKEALYIYELEIQMRDSINNTETKKASIKKQFQYQYEKKAAADSVKNAEEKKVKSALLTAQEAQLKQEKTKSYALYGGLALMMVFAGFMVNRFRVTNKQKQIIEHKEIETQKQNEIITIQKHLVEEKHKEITDSINYAERIQRSFLATKELLDENLRDYFVFFQPKDVVSGDFYWASFAQASAANGNRNLFYLATADSTGHGVPGAIMSILNISCLEKSVEEEKITEPSGILNHTRTKIIERLKKDGSAEGGKDGMDCSLMCFDFKNSKLTYAAANNPVWIVRENNLIELAPDKMPVGKHDKDIAPFTQHSIDLQKGDIVYALTDGFPDQFGGPNGKKFKHKQLKELLISMAQLPMQDQKELLETTLNNWKGNLEQVDDICVIGIRI